jgi:hypothetical protein
MERMLSLAAFAFLSLSGLFLTPAAEAALLTNGTGGPYNGYVCADVSGGATAPRTKVQAWDCHGWFNQQWSFQGWTIYGIGSTGSAQTCLDVNGAGTAPGTIVQLYPCNGTVAQQWYFYSGRLYNPNSRRCLDAGNRANGTQLVINNCHTGASQQWQFK